MFGDFLILPAFTRGGWPFLLNRHSPGFLRICNDFTQLWMLAQETITKRHSVGTSAGPRFQAFRHFADSNFHNAAILYSCCGFGF